MDAFIVFVNHWYTYCSAVYERQMGGRGNNPAEPNLFLWSKEDGGLPHMALVTCQDTAKEPKTHNRVILVSGFK